MISTITLDTYKQQISSGDAFNLSDSFNGRVGDEQVPLVVQFKERGLAQQFQDGLVPFLTGFVGSLDENNQVTAETGEAVSYVGTSDDIVGLGRVKMNLPGTMFPQEGYFYGFLGLQNADGKRVTTFNVWFRVYNGNPDMFVNKAPFRTELQKFLDAVKLLVDDANGDLNKWKQKLTDLFTTLSAQGADTATLLTTLQAQIKQSNLFTQSQMDELLGSLTSFKPTGSNLIDKLNNEFSSRAVNVQWYGAKGDGSHDDLAAINQAIAASNPGTKIVFPAGNYNISGNIMIGKKVTLLGTKPAFDSNDLTAGTIIRGGGLFFTTGSSGSVVNGLGVVVAKGFTNGFDIRGTVKGIQIEDCLTIAQSHGFLIESYDGLVDGVKVINCEAYNSIHGFISKATRTVFQNCLVSGTSQWGFGIISDNIQGADKLGAAIDNKVINCRAINSGASFIQYRRNYYEDKSDNIPCDNNQFIGCSNTNCVYGITIGDAFGDTGNGQYHSYPVTNTNISNYNEVGGRVRALYSKNLLVNGIQLQTNGEAAQDSTHSNIGMTVVGITGQPFGQYADLHLLDKSATPSIGFGRVFRTANTEKTLITSFTDAIFGEIYTVIIWDNQTIIDSSDTINMMNGALSGWGSSITFRCQNGNFFEISRSGAIDRGYQTSATNANIEPGIHNFIDIAQADTDKAVKVHINNPDLHATNLTIFVRSTKNHITPGGFDTDQFVVPSDLPLGDLGFGTGLMTNWQYMAAVHKYVLVNYRLAQYA